MEAMNDAERILCAFPAGLDYHEKRGRVLFRLGEPMPKRIWDEHGKPLPHTEQEMYLFFGWMLERAKYLMKLKDVEDALQPDPYDPRPPEALAA